jgi:hypothetical protein
MLTAGNEHHTHEEQDMNILEEMNIEIGRASVAARLADTPEQINERYRMSRNGAIGTGVLFAATLFSGQLWLPALLPLFAPSVLFAVYTRGFGIKLADRLFASNVQKWSAGAMLMMAYMISFAPLDALALGGFFMLLLIYKQGADNKVLKRNHAVALCGRKYVWRYTNRRRYHTSLGSRVSI